jgi:hypothetical protein
LRPNLFKQFGVPVILQKPLGQPMAVGEEHVLIGVGLPELQVSATFGPTDLRFVRVKNAQKGLHTFWLKGHFNDSD